MKPRALTLTIVVLAGCGTGAAAQAQSPTGLTQTAASSVAAAQLLGGVRTAFAFGPQTILAGAPAHGSLRLTTANGTTASVTTSGGNSSLAVVRTSQLALRPLAASTVELQGGDEFFVLGAPLGYQAQQIRRVRLPHIVRSGQQMIVVPERLPVTFRGAPVVTVSGHLVGAVAITGSRSWTLDTLGDLQALVSQSATSRAGGLSVVAILAIAIIVIALIAGAGVVAARRRRSRAFATTTPQSAPRQPRSEPVRQASQPLVRLRDPHPTTHEASQSGEADDFDIVLKSREEPE